MKTVEKKEEEEKKKKMDSWAIYNGEDKNKAKKNLIMDHESCDEIDCTLSSNKEKTQQDHIPWGKINK